jgi:outer membrane receptor protein involved in Fe transport
MSSQEATEGAKCRVTSQAVRIGPWLFVLLSALSISVHSQEVGTGGVSGIVVNTWNGIPLPGVVVTVRGTTLATQTDANGRYELKNVPPGDQVLRFSKAGHASAVVTDVRVLAAQTTTVNGNLRPEFYEMEEYEITAEEFTEEASQILLERQQSSALTDAIGADQFSKLGAGDAAEALSKVSGASIAGGKFAVVRGLADRYTSTTFNGVDIPSADPDRRAVQLDLFPSKFIKRIEVSKTFLPNMPGGFAGGAIDIVPRSIPEHFEFEIELGVSYNTKASLRDDFPMTGHGSKDWLAMDDGTRKLPGAARRAPSFGQSDITTRGFKQSFGSSQMAPRFGDSPVNTSGFIGIGDSRKVEYGLLGYLAGLTYKNTYEYRDDARVIQYQDIGSGPRPKVDKRGIEGIIEYSWSALVTLGWEVNEHHDFGFNFMYVQAAEDKATRYRGQHQDVTTPGESYLEQDILTWTERNLTYYQVRGGHQFPEMNDVRLDWATSIASTSQDEPDFRIFQFLAEPGGPFFNPNGTVEPTKPFRSWRSLAEENSSTRIDLTVPLPSYNDRNNALKGGVATSQSQRTLDQRAFSAFTRRFDHPFHENGNPNEYLAPENLRFINYANYSQTFQSSGEQTIQSWYLMGDWHALNWLRLVGGVRSEKTELLVDTVNLTKNERSSSDIQRTDLLPAASATIYLRENLLLRGAWSETVVRPTYREISAASEIDAVRGRVFKGNPDLTFSTSMNYDVRLEWFPHAGSLVAVSAFMKEITGPIEQTSVSVNNDLVTFVNSPSADVQGLEFELRESLGNLWKPLEDFSVGFNAAYIQSEVPLTSDQRSQRGDNWGDTATTRSLYDQPEYVINGDITWDFKRTGTRLTVSGGAVGRRLVLAGLAEPDDFEEPTPQLDIFLTQQLGKNWKLKFSARNLLDPAYQITQEWPRGGQLPVESFTRGMTFGLSLGYAF